MEKAADEARVQETEAAGGQGPARAAVSAEDLRQAIARCALADEATLVEQRARDALLSPERRNRIEAAATRLVKGVRAARTRFGMLDAFLLEFGLSSREGVALMCLAEALLRIPDAETANRLIRDTIGAADWERHLGHAGSVFVNASTWALMLTGRVVRLEPEEQKHPSSLLGRLMARAGEPVIRQAMVQAMRILGRQFVMGRTIEEALERAREAEGHGGRFSYDMLGEAARTGNDAERYFETYHNAIAAISRSRGTRTVVSGPGISVKLSALHPRFEEARRDQVLRELAPRLHALAMAACRGGIGLTVDAEEAERLELTLDLVEAVFSDREAFAGWEGFGLAVQAYQKRALPVLCWLEHLAGRQQRRLMLRLVKGAYWDSEIKRAQERGLEGYPVFTRKVNTDVSYLACARYLLARRNRFYPQFATHNAHTVAAVLEMAGDRDGFEFQRLHGMGEPLYHQLAVPEGPAPESSFLERSPVGDGPLPCRVYAPVGSHEDLLAYLVRRLLENGANSSFVNRIQDDTVPIAEMVADPASRALRLAVKPHPRIPLPAALFGDTRRNAAGLDLSAPHVTGPLQAAMAEAWSTPWQAGPLVGGESLDGPETPVTDPADRRREVGMVIAASPAQVDAALAQAARAAADWSATPVEERAVCLEQAAAALEERRAEFMALLVREAGKTLPEALAEVREAVDFCRYYAACARQTFARPLALPGPTGEENRLSWHGRGPFVCISPWNFPLAIFMGQVTAALAAGNPVLAKPAEQTPLIAWRATQILLEAGVPPEVLHLLPGEGAGVGGRLVADRRIAGVAFTGSIETARRINRVLADRSGPLAPLIAETGGQNALIADSTALPEQVVDDVLTSAFRSAGQRCSALRVLFIQDGLADRVLKMLKGAAQELLIGDPGRLETDVGPVIDAAAATRLNAHAARMEREASLLFRLELDAGLCGHGSFFPPQAYVLDSLSRLDREVFGPVLHVIRFAPDRLDAVLEAIAATGYGLTLGIHSRIETTIRYIHARLPVGNTYVNRNMVGAVVGVQPFGGEGLSGTGPKAGGPHYLPRFAVERTFTLNTTAAGGNATLVSLNDETSHNGFNGGNGFNGHGR